MTDKTQLHVAICGGIAVGKTTIGNHLSKLIQNSIFVEEQPEQNIYLSDFYKDMKHWGFHSRIAMLSLFINYYNSAKKYNNKVLIYDRTVHELITFARLQLKMGNLTKGEYRLYTQLYKGVLELINPPDVVIYLYCKPLIALRRIRERGRDFEKGVSSDYLNNINHQYDVWIRSLPNSYPVLKIDTTHKVDCIELKNKIYQLTFYSFQEDKV